MRIAWFGHAARPVQLMLFVPALLLGISPCLRPQGNIWTKLYGPHVTSMKLLSASAMVLFSTSDGGRTWSPKSILPNLDEGGGQLAPSDVVDSTWIAAQHRTTGFILRSADLARIPGRPSPAPMLIRLTRGFISSVLSRLPRAGC